MSFGISHKYIADRLSLLREVFDFGGFKNGHLWGLQPSRIRFILAKSPKEMKVPYLLGESDTNTIENALIELVALIGKRFGETEIKCDIELSADSIGVVRELAEMSYRTDFFPEGYLRDRLVKNVLFFSQIIDGAILQKWLGKRGHGRQLMNILMNIYFKALKEESNQGGREITAYIAHLAIMNFINSTKNRLKKIVMKGVSYESLDYSLSVTLYFLLEASIWKVFETFSEKQSDIQTRGNKICSFQYPKYLVFPLHKGPYYERLYQPI